MTSGVPARGSAEAPPMRARGEGSVPTMPLEGHCAMVGAKCGPRVREEGGAAVQLDRAPRPLVASRSDWKCPPLPMDKGGCGSSAIELGNGFIADGEACEPPFG
jgi:hypothetical protein